MEQGALTFNDHLRELKHRLFLVACNFIVGSILGFLLHKPIEAILQKPLGQTLYYSSPTGGLSFIMQIAFGVGFLLTLPLLLYQTMQFIRPALKPVKTRNIVLLILLVFILSLTAVVYVYFVSLPAALHFLVSFNSESIQALININDYMRFLLAYLGGAILAFQLPLFLLFMNKIRPFSPGGLQKLQAPVIVGAMIVGGVITPTVDPINQILLAGPIIILFEITVLCLWLVNRNKSTLRHQKAVNVQQPRMLGRVSNAAHPVLQETVVTPNLQTTRVATRRVVSTSPRSRLIMDIIR